MQRLIPRFAIGLLILVLGLVIAWTWRSFQRPPIVTRDVQKTAPEIRKEERPQVQHAYGPAGSGVTKEGMPFSFTSFSSSAGVGFFQWTESHSSPRGARRALEKALRGAIRIIKRDPMFDETGRVAGEQVVATFSPKSRYGKASLLWTEGQTFGFVASSSGDSIIEYQKD
jgi:hypothetical protein